MTATPTKLMALLNRLFVQQARDMMARTRLNGDVPDTRSWADAMAKVVKPLLLEMWQQGMVEASARIAAKVGQDEVVMPRAVTSTQQGAMMPNMADGMRRIEVGNAAIFGSRVDSASTVPTKRLQQRWHDDPVAARNETLLLKRGTRVVCKASGSRDVDFSFDLFNPRVLEAVDHATYDFCRETMDTATTDVRTALEELRQLMREGLPQGDAVALLAVKVREIFADPYRAFRIATTEGSRAIHGGQAMAALEAGVTRHTWLASSDACELCLALDGKTVNIGEPFWVNPRGGPYARVLYPPLHPHCFCTTTEELD